MGLVVWFHQVFLSFCALIWFLLAGVLDVWHVFLILMETIVFWGRFQWYCLVGARDDHKINIDRSKYQPWPHMAPPRATW